MMVRIDKKTCDRCGTCISVCRANALMLLCEELIVDDARCTRCGTCVDLCAFGALAIECDTCSSSPELTSKDARR